MSAYAIADVEVIDSAGYEEYRQQVPATNPPLRAIHERTARSHLVVTEGL